MYGWEEGERSVGEEWKGVEGRECTDGRNGGRVGREEGRVGREEGKLS